MRVAPSLLGTQSQRYWRCRKRGHVVESRFKPDFCRKCKEVDSAVWLSMFDETSCPEIRTLPEQCLR
jgi:ABC-type ATPase with predicted acetyltransferase domain